MHLKYANVNLRWNGGPTTAVGHVRSEEKFEGAAMHAKDFYPTKAIARMWYNDNDSFSGGFYWLFPEGTTEAEKEHRRGCAILLSMETLPKNMR